MIKYYLPFFNSHRKQENNLLKKKNKKNTSLSELRAITYPFECIKRRKLMNRKVKVILGLMVEVTVPITVCKQLTNEQRAEAYNLVERISRM